MKPNSIDELIHLLMKYTLQNKSIKNENQEKNYTESSFICASFLITC